MQLMLTNIFKRATKQVSGDPGLLSSDVPRYPPFTEGFPRYPTQDLIESQRPLINEISEILRINKVHFDELALPVINSYAAYVHLLPASERHHHRGMGGLFRHGLEVARNAAKFALADQFCANDLPKDKDENETRWQFAAFIAGLTHDLGKPMSDLAVRDKAGLLTWNPYESSLTDWLYNHGVEKYFISWTPDRNKKHKNFALLMISKILNDRVSAYLNANGPSVMNALLESLVGNSALGILTSIVMEADQASTSRDLANSRMDVDEHSYGVPVERFFFDALRTYVSSSPLNCPGATVWVTGGSLFLSWPRVAEDVYQIIQSGKIPGFPKSPDSLADILLERGYASYSADENGNSKRYWTVYPECLFGLSLNCLRLDDLDLVFTSEPPPNIKASFTAPILLSQPTTPMGTAVITGDKANSNSISEESISATSTRVNDEPRPIIRPESQSIEILSNQVEQVSKTSSKAISDHKPTLKDKVDNQAASHYKDYEIPQDEPHKKATKGDIGRTTPSKEIKGSRINIGDDIKRILDDIVAKGKQGIDIIEKISDGSFAILYPSKVSDLGKPQEILSALRNGGALQMLSGLNTATQRVDGKTYLVLTKAVKKALLEMGYGKDHPPETLPTTLVKNKPGKANAFASDSNFEQEIDLRKLPTHSDFTVEIVDGVECLVVGPAQLFAIAQKIHEPIISVKMKLRGRVDYHSDNKQIYYMRVKL